jgi:hypothetical protein
MDDLELTFPVGVDGVERVGHLVFGVERGDQHPVAFIARPSVDDRDHGFELRYERRHGLRVRPPSGGCQSQGARL